MNPRILRGTAALIACAGTLGAVQVAGCGGGGARPAPGAPGTGINLDTVTRTGVLALPAGSAVAPDSVTIATSVAQQKAGKDGKFSVKAFGGGPQFTLALSPGGKPMMAGWIDDKRATISPRTTAEVLLYFELCAFLLPPEAALKCQDLIAASPDVAPVEEAIATAIKANPDGLATQNSTVTAALKAARDRMAPLTGGQSARSATTRGVKYDPAESRSGITLMIEGLNSIRLQNRYRRRAHAIVDRVSYVPADGGNAVPSPASVTALDVPMPAGVSTLIGTLVDIIYGNLAYTERSTDLIPLPVTPSDARSTRYRVAVVGPGLSLGDFDRLSQAEKNKAGLVTGRAVLIDCLLPFVLNVVIPLNGEKIDSYLEWANGSPVVQDFVGTMMVSVPAIWDKSRAGDFKGAVWDAYQTIQTSNTLRLAFLQVVMQGAHKLKGSAAANQFADLATSFLNVLTLGDMFLTTFDSVIQVANYVQSSLADVWTVDVTQAKVTLTPANSTIFAYEKVLLTARVPSATGPNAPVLAFKFHTTGNVGKIFNEKHPDGPDSFDSSQEWVWYLAEDGKAGQDSVDVEVFEVKGSQRVSLGTAMATIRVRDPRAILSPAILELDPSKTGTLTVKLDPPADQVVYHWTNTGKAGHLKNPVGDPDDDFESPAKMAPYLADAFVAEDTVTVEVYEIKQNGRELIGRSTALVKVAGGPEIKAQFKELTTWKGPPGPSDRWAGSMGYYWPLPKVPGVRVYKVTIHTNGADAPAGMFGNTPITDGYYYWWHDPIDVRRQFQLPIEEGWTAWYMGFGKGSIAGAYGYRSQEELIQTIQYFWDKAATEHAIVAKWSIVVQAYK